MNRHYPGPLFNSVDVPGPEGVDSSFVRATMNPGVDAPTLFVHGSAPELRRHMLHHRAFSVILTGSFDDLAFLLPAADLITALWMRADVDDVSALAGLTHLRTLSNPPPSADPLLAALPRLRILSLDGAHDFQRLGECTALRVLTLTKQGDLFGTGATGPLFSDLHALPPLPSLEVLSLIVTGMRSLDGIDRFSNLRTLQLGRIVLRDDAGASFLAERFGVTEMGTLVARYPADKTRLSQMVTRLDADRWRAETLADAAQASARPALVTAETPACVVILIDRSTSTLQRFGIDLRVIRDPAAPAHDVTTYNGDGPDGDVLLCEGMTSAVNAFLRALAERCIIGGRVAHDVHVGLVEYGARVGSAWNGALQGRDLVPIAEIIAHPLRATDDGPVWLEPDADGETPLGEAMEVARGMIERWSRDHGDSVPPVVINLTAAKATGDDFLRHAWGIRSVTTAAGPALLFNAEREGSWGVPYFGIEGYRFSEIEPLFQVASPLPPRMVDAAREGEYRLTGNPRGYIHQSAAADFENALHIFTALPGMPWDSALVRQPLPPHLIGDQELAANRYEVRGPPSPRKWKPRKLKGPMTEELFWQVVDLSGRQNPGPDEQSDRLVQLLVQFGEPDIVEFDRILDARMDDAYRWDLWAVAFITQDGCSDDGFEYFCAWLIAQGRKYFEASLADPAHAAKRIVPGDRPEFEGLLAVAGSAYESTTEKDDFHERRGPATRVGPKGRQWTEEELPKLFPRLVKKYSRR